MLFVILEFVDQNVLQSAEAESEQKPKASASLPVRHPREGRQKSSSICLQPPRGSDGYGGR